MLKANDIVYYNGKCFVLVKEIHMNVIDDPVPHKGYKLTDLAGNEVDEVIIDSCYNDVVVLVRR